MNGMECTFFSTSLILYSVLLCLIKWLSHSKQLPTAFFRIFWTCFHPTALFPSPYDMPNSAGKPRHHPVPSRYPDKEVKQRARVSFTTISFKSNAAHLNTGILCVYQFDGNTRSKTVLDSFGAVILAKHCGLNWVDNLATSLWYQRSLNASWDKTPSILAAHYHSKHPHLKKQPSWQMQCWMTPTAQLPQGDLQWLRLSTAGFHSLSHTWISDLYLRIHRTGTYPEVLTSALSLVLMTEWKHTGDARRDRHTPAGITAALFRKTHTLQHLG